MEGLKGSKAENQLFWRPVVSFTHRGVFVNAHHKHAHRHTQNLWLEQTLDRPYPVHSKQTTCLRVFVCCCYYIHFCVLSTVCASSRRSVMRQQPCDSHLNVFGCSWEENNCNSLLPLCTSPHNACGRQDDREQFSSSNLRLHLPTQPSSLTGLSHPNHPTFLVFFLSTLGTKTNQWTGLNCLSPWITQSEACDHLKQEYLQFLCHFPIWKNVNVSFIFTVHSKQPRKKKNVLDFKCSGKGEDLIWSGKLFLCHKVWSCHHKPLITPDFKLSFCHMQEQLTGGS